MLDDILPSMDRASPARLPERMDRPGCDPARLRDALETLARANRWFGARRMTVPPAAAMTNGRPPGPIRILDVGTGSGDIGAALARRLREGGWRPLTVLADLHPTTLRIARDRLAEEDGPARHRGDGPDAAPPIPGGPDDGACSFVRLTGASLPFAGDSVDVAVSATMLHHLEADEAARFLRELDRVSRLGWVVTDLCRSAAAYAAVRLLAATLWRRHPLPRRDGPVSVRRAFTAAEARRLLDDAGLEDAEVEALWPFRLRIRRRSA